LGDRVVALTIDLRGNVLEDFQWNGAYFAHNHRTGSGTLIAALLVGGAIRRTKRQPSGSASVCTVLGTSAALDGVEITDCGDRFTTPWFQVAAPPGTITCTPPAAAAK
jgi:hypothetical protein